MVTHIGAGIAGFDAGLVHLMSHDCSLDSMGAQRRLAAQGWPSGKVHTAAKDGISPSEAGAWAEAICRNRNGRYPGGASEHQEAPAR